MKPRILIVEDDTDIASVLTRGLGSHGYDVVHSDTVADAGPKLADVALSAAIVDVMIGRDSGLDLVRDARSAGITKPILMLSALSEVEDRTAGIEAGADDYVVKPFVLDELVARLEVQLRRARVDLLDPDILAVTSANGPVVLTQREFQVLELLINHRDQVISRGQIFDTLWLEEGSTAENVVDVYVGYLRKKLMPKDIFQFEIKTVRGKGFMAAFKP